MTSAESAKVVRESYSDADNHVCDFPEFSIGPMSHTNQFNIVFNPTTPRGRRFFGSCIALPQTTSKTRDKISNRTTKNVTVIVEFMTSFPEFFLSLVLDRCCVNRLNRESFIQR